MSKSTVLYVGVGNPFASGAGYLLRQRMLLEALGEDYTLTMTFFDGPASLASQFSGRYWPLPMPRIHRHGRIRSLLANALSKIPQSYREHDATTAAQIVKSLQPEDFDAVFVYRVDFAYFAGVLNHPRLLLDFDDPEHLRKRDRLAVLSGSGRQTDRHATLDLHRLRRFELNAAGKALASFVCQEHDRDAFDDPKPIVVPNCVEAPKICPTRESLGDDILFVGNVQGGAHSPNVDAVRWFVQHVWPLVRARNPRCEFHIVGPVSDWLRQELEIVAGVRVIGFVPNLQDALRAAPLTVAPIRFGTGTRIKILESMAWGCPVVSTPKGCEGLAVQHERDILIGSSPPELADHCLRLLGDGALRERIGRAGFDLVKTNYDRQARHPWLVDLLRGIIARAVEMKAGERAGR